jgi:vacuolar-type H+-ATPase subunit H
LQERSVWESKKEIWFASFLKEAEKASEHQRETRSHFEEEMTKKMERFEREVKERGREERDKLVAEQQQRDLFLQQQQAAQAEQTDKQLTQQSEWRNVVWSEIC